MRNIDNVLSLNISIFGDLLHRIYPQELQIKDTTDSIKSASYLDLYVGIARKGKLLTKLYDKCNDFILNIIPELAVTTQRFYIALEFLQLGVWNRVMLLKD